MRLRQSRLLILLLIAAGATAVGVTGGVTRAPDSSGVSRVERTMVLRWGSSCGEDNCGIATTPIRYTTPPEVGSVDVTLTVTLDYKTSRGDVARADVSLDDGTAPYDRIRPSYPLGTARTPTSTTLTWVRRDLQAGGKAYTFWLSMAPGDANDDLVSSVSGRRMTVVLESWTAGD